MVRKSEPNLCITTAVVETRRELVDALGASFATVAAWVHRLQQGVRLM